MRTRNLFPAIMVTIFALLLSSCASSQTSIPPLRNITKRYTDRNIKSNTYINLNTYLNSYSCYTCKYQHCDTEYKDKYNY